MVVERRYRFLQKEKDRRGNARIYFRVDRGPRVRIRETLGSEEFDKRYHELMRQHAAGALKSPPRDAIKPGTFRWLCEQYMASVEFKGLDPRTQYVRRQNIDHMCAEPIASGDQLTFRDCPLPSFGRKAVRILRDRKAATPDMANERVKILRAIFRWALARDDEIKGVISNAARDVTFLDRKNPDGFHTWTDSELEQFEKAHPIGTKARLAYALLRYPGARRSDIIRLGRQHVYKDGGVLWLKFTAHKGRKRKPRVVDIPLLPELQAVIAASRTGDLTFVVTEFGRPYSPWGFGNWFRRQCRLAGLPSGCSAHGIRKATAVIAAEGGASESTLEASHGWAAGSKEAARYRREADRKKLASEGTRLMVRPNREQKSLTLDTQTPPVRENETKKVG